MRSNLLYVVQKTRDITAGDPPRLLVDNRQSRLDLGDKRQESSRVVNEELSNGLLRNAREPKFGDKLHQHRGPTMTVKMLELTDVPLVG